MTQGAVNPIEAMLAQLRRGFLEELPGRCDEIEDLVLKLEGAKDDQETFQALYRNVHSLKGSGGTHGLGIVTRICHDLENRLSESGGGLDPERTNAVLAHVDLLRRVALEAENQATFTAIEEALAGLQAAASRGRRAVLLAESSRAMQGLYQQALGHLPMCMTCVDDGLGALQLLLDQPFDYAMLAGELKGLNGVAVASALRVSGGRNATVPVILISSNPQAIPAHLQVQAILPRDQALIPNLERILTA